MASVFTIWLLYKATWSLSLVCSSLLYIANYSLFHPISVSLMFPIPCNSVVFKHVYFWLPYASAAVGNSVANSVTGFACYCCGDHTFLQTQ